MARTVLSMALLLALGLAILHLVSAEQQQQELEDNSNEVVQAKHAEVDQVRILREAEPRRDSNRERKRPRKPSHRRSKKVKKCGKNGKKCENSRRKGGKGPLGRSKKNKRCRRVNGEKICNNSRKKAGRRSLKKSKGKKCKKDKNGNKICTRSNKKGNQQGNKGKGAKKGKKKPQHVLQGGARQLLCNTAPEASQTISTGIISYRKYYNHDKQIKRTIKDLARLVQKSKPEKLVKYTTAADELKALTTDGTICPADPAMNAKVIETAAALAACAGTASPIVTVCKAPAPLAELEPKIVVCETEYKPWIAGFKVCFEAKPADCACFVPLNAGTPPVSDAAPMSCMKPNAGGADWIKDASVAAKDAVLACKAEITKCKDSVTAASALMSACGVKPAATARTNRRRKLLNQALLKSQFNKINLH